MVCLAKHSTCGASGRMLGRINSGFTGKSAMMNKLWRIHPHGRDGWVLEMGNHFMKQQKTLTAPKEFLPINLYSHLPFFFFGSTVMVIISTPPFWYACGTWEPTILWTSLLPKGPGPCPVPPVHWPPRSDQRHRSDAWRDCSLPESVILLMEILHHLIR